MKWVNDGGKLGVNGEMGGKVDERKKGVRDWEVGSLERDYEGYGKGWVR